MQAVAFVEVPKDNPREDSKMIEVPWNRCNRSSRGVIPAFLDGVASGFSRITLILRSNLVNLPFSVADDGCDDDDKEELMTHKHKIRPTINHPLFHHRSERQDNSKIQKVIFLIDSSYSTRYLSTQTKRLENTNKPSGICCSTHADTCPMKG